MSLSFDGNTITFDGTVTITNATDLTTGVATLMLTPSGGVGNIPALLQGTPGLPAIFDSATATSLPAGSAPTVTLTPVSPGGAGQSSHYTLAFGIPQGAAGTTGTFAIGNATDLDKSAQIDAYIIRWDNSEGKYRLAGELCGDSFNTITFTAANGNTSPHTLQSITIEAQPFDWRPNVKGFATPSGSANTHVDLICRLNNATTGDQVGYGFGVTGAGAPGGTIPALPVTLISAFGEAIGDNTYGRVPKGESATLYFQAIQTANTTDAFLVPAASCAFTVKVDPIPGTS